MEYPAPDVTIWGTAMIRSPGGRLHVRTRKEFELELDRMEVEVRCEESERPRLDIDAVLAKAGYFTNSAGIFLEVD